MWPGRASLTIVARLPAAPAALSAAGTMSSIATRLAAVLRTVRRPGDFFVAGRTELFAPSLEVEGVGPVALPLLPMQARQLVAAAEPAPYGRGEETLIDPAVRRCRQIGPDRVPHPRPALGPHAGRDPRPRGRGAGRGRADRGRVLQAATLRPGQPLRRPSRHREGTRHVRDPRGRAAI